MRTNSIRLHLGLGISLAVSQVLLLLIGAGSAATWANGLATFALLLLLIRTMTLHRDRRDRLLEILAAVQSAAEGEVNLRLPASEDDEAGRVAGAVNQLVATVRERARVAQAERELDQLMVQKTPNGLAVIDAALALDPADRPGSAGAMAQMRTQAHSVTRGTAPTPAPRWRSRRSMWVAASYPIVSFGSCKRLAT